jgi:hydroxymethylbilane synthase
MTAIRVGTRGSQLALWQANEVSRKLAEHGYRAEIVVVKTTGDKRQDVSLAEIGGKGLFIKELEDALDRQEIDVAVHSLKDVPSIIPDRFLLAGFLERADARDVWIHPERLPIDTLPEGSVVGTSSPRRRAQLLEKHPRLKVEPIRGNVETRIAKARTGEYAGVVLAAAGLVRLGRGGDATSWFRLDEMIPAAGQGIIVIETLEGNAAAIGAARSITHAQTEVEAKCERAVLQRFGTRLDCYSAVAVHATTKNGEITIRAFFEEDVAVRSEQTGNDVDRVVDAVYEELRLARR